jgi:hypothetical protein
MQASSSGGGENIGLWAAISLIMDSPQKWQFICKKGE